MNPNYEIGWCIKYLGDAVAFQDRENDFKNNIERAKKCLDEFVNEQNKVELTDKEAAISQYLHTWLRKCGHERYHTTLCILVQRHLGLSAWQNFIRGLLKNEFDFFKAFSYAEEQKDKGVDNIHDSIMINTLWSWQGDWKFVKKDIRTAFKT